MTGASSGAVVLRSRTPDVSLLGAGVAIALAAANLRPAITSTAPLLPEIRDLWGLGNAGAAALSTVPIIALAAGSLLAIRVAHRLGSRGGTTLGLVLIVAGLMIRPWRPALLTAGTAVAAVGIACVSVLLPRSSPPTPAQQRPGSTPSRWCR